MQGRVGTVGWIEGIGEAVIYIEENITEELDIESIAKRAFVSPFYFQKCFAMPCGFTVDE
jgi:AraC family transcriptional regulator